MDNRKIADLSDDEIIADMRGMGLSLDSHNSGHNSDVLLKVLRSLAEDYEPLFDE